MLIFNFANSNITYISMSPHTVSNVVAELMFKAWII